MSQEVSIQHLKECFTYNPSSGLLSWSVNRPRNHFIATCNYNAYMSCFAGRPAGSLSHEGYIQVSVKGKVFMAHRVAWAITHDYWPIQTIDHIDGNKTNNRLKNLRDVSVQENAKNARLSRRNKSGVTGVIWRPERKKWEALICINSTLKSLGAYGDISEAIAVRKQAEQKHNFHPNHGHKKCL